MNSVHLIGRLATDVEVKEVNGGSKVSSFILAVDRNAEEADFFRIKSLGTRRQRRERQIEVLERAQWSRGHTAVDRNAEEADFAVLRL